MAQDPPKRRYDSTLRRRSAAETRDRIVAAGVDVLRGVAIWNWGVLTARTVAARAGISERTVYRHFETEKALRDAVLGRLEAESGVVLGDLELEGVADAAARIFAFVSSFPIQPRTHVDATVMAANVRQRQALEGAVAPWVEGWTETDARLVPALLDVMWSVVSYERLVVDWQLGSDDAVTGLRWAIGLIEDAVRVGRRPSDHQP
ncbi:MAG TPA: TetR/AcrR family transcriptional regulator [Acidimicrobiales bacterium]|nr:TetR/AcrR family transcriptional regulator [Acidimicrobiales bacterium]